MFSNTDKNNISSKLSEAKLNISEDIETLTKYLKFTINNYDNKNVNLVDELNHIKTIEGKILKNFKFINNLIIYLKKRNI